MADRDLFIITRATTQDLLTLTEAKLLLGLDPNDTSKDEQLQLQISIASATIAEMANRTFAEEELIESWREIGDGRLFLSHWPIEDPTGIISVTSGSVELIAGEYDLEGDSGKLSVYNGTPVTTPTGVVYWGNTGTGSHWAEPAVVHYIGGYQLPEEAPLPLKQAAVLLIRDERMRNQQAQVAGMRQLRHKEASVSFHDPNMLLSRMMGQGGGQSPVQQTVMALIKQYIRIEV